MNHDLEKINEFVEFHELGLVLRSGISEDESQKIAALIRTLGSRVDFLLGDWCNQHASTFGEESLQKIATQLSFNFSDLRRARQSTGIPLEHRKSAIAPRLHATVVRLAEPSKQLEWIAIAERENLSGNDLARSIRAGTVMKTEVGQSKNSHGGVATLSKIVFDFLAWLRAVNRGEAWTDRDREEALHEMSPIIKFAEEIQHLRDETQPEPELAQPTDET